MITSAPLGERSRLSSRLDERLQHGFQRDSSLSRARLSALELDPAFVEAIKHLDALFGVHGLVRPKSTCRERHCQRGDVSPTTG